MLTRPPCTQLQDAVKGKLSRCEHIDIDWGVGQTDQDDDIYHTPAELKSSGAMKRSGTADNLNNGVVGLAPPNSHSPRLSHKAMSSPSMEARRRPMSQLVDTRPYSSSSADPDHSPARVHHPLFNIPPPPSAPPPPPRTVSKTAEALQPK